MTDELDPVRRLRADGLLPHDPPRKDEVKELRKHPFNVLPAVNTLLNAMAYWINGPARSSIRTGADSSPSWPSVC